MCSDTKSAIKKKMKEYRKVESKMYNSYGNILLK